MVANYKFLVFVMVGFGLVMGVGGWVQGEVKWVPVAIFGEEGFPYYNYIASSYISS